MDHRIAPAPSTAAMLARLVGFDTVSHRSNLPLIGFVREYLAAHDVPCRLALNAEGTKASLHATIGPVQPGGLALSGHVDTVSVEGQAWSGDPFMLRRQEGRLIGRGACDMKGFVAAMLGAVPAIKARNPVRPVHLLLTYDEEVGYHGVQRLIADFDASGLRPELCVIGEPSGMLPILGQKGRLIVRARITGHGAHSSASQNGVNAAHAAGEAIAWIAAESRRLAREGPAEAGFDPPWSTLQVSNLASRNLPSSVPGEASLDIEWRTVPAHRPAADLARLRAHVAEVIEPPMRAVQPGTGFAWEALLDLAALSLPPEHRLARAALAATGAKAGGKVSFCSEGAFYQPADIACLVCGPGHLAQVHQPDEWVGEDQLALCDRFILDLVERLAC